MTLQPRYIPDVPERTVEGAKPALRKGNRYVQMRDELGTLFNDEQFTSYFLLRSGQRSAMPTQHELV